ncbi:hypothetical protein WICPIJ_004430 [Wickerhamomyces pijperi]|uniref:pyridoxal kinase n=1 Tax=Wickerhamomyces pijperi TaxID=599730 RepID=A0A9P8Q844_WICPI|nr:hypothetical protein WICPIJ_004430 [Wickerhamomyces pijperi]
MTQIEVHPLLAIQSHVVHGYVGNKSATFPLQCQGWDVDVLNTVNFSNHTGYGSVRGTKITLQQIKELYLGIKEIGVNYEALLTGYSPNDEILSYTGEIGADIKKANPNCLWLLDPVMGDEGTLYVSESVIPIYKEILQRGLVDIITPNQFEVELLVDFKITCVATLKKALLKMHDVYRLKNIVISSLTLEEFPHTIITVCSQSDCKGNVSSNYFQVPIIESYFTGVGDLFSALLIDRVFKYHEEDQEYLINSVNEVLSIMSRVLLATSNYARAKLGDTVKSKMGSPDTMKCSELRLIACRDLYSSRERNFQSSPL